MVARIAQLEYSTYGHIHTVGDKVFEGLKEAGVQVDRFRIEETLPKEVLAKMGAPENLRADLPVFEVSKLPEYDGILFGFPTRYGRTPAQVSALFDRTGGIWAKGELVGKFASVFVSTASQHGGQETTALTTYPFFAHHGMNIVNFGYQHPAMFGLDEVTGSSAYGAGTLAAGDGSRQPSEAELSIAHAHGKHFGSVVATHKLGSEKLAAKLAAEKNGEPAAAAGTEGATKSAEETQEAPKEESADKQAEQDKPAEETPAEKKEDAKEDAPAEENVKQKKGTFKKIKNRISKIL